MRIAKHIVSLGLAVGLSAPAFAARVAAPQATTRVAAKGARTAASARKATAPRGTLALKVTPRTKRPEFPYGSALRHLEDFTWTSVKEILADHQKGTLPTTFEDREHDLPTAHVDLAPAWRAYQADLRGQRAPLNVRYSAWKQQHFEKHFGKYLRDLPSDEAVYHVIHNEPHLFNAYPIRQVKAAGAAESPVHASAESLAATTAADPRAKKLLTGALKDPVAMALLFQVAHHAELSRKTDPESRAAIAVYRGIANILKAQKREFEGPGLAHLFPEENTVEHFIHNRMWGAQMSQAKELLFLSPERIRSAAAGLFTLKTVKDSVLGIRL